MCYRFSTVTHAPPELDRLGSCGRVELRFHDVIDALPQTKPPAAEDLE